MAALNDANVAIVGLGAIGGSVALALLDRGVKPRGFASDVGDAKAAAAAGVTVRSSLSDLAKDADVVLIATPLDAIESLAGKILDELEQKGRQASVLHAGSLQRADALGKNGKVREHLIGTHPIAGTHSVGFAAAAADMFRGAIVSVESRASARQRSDAELLWSLAGAGEIVYADAEQHDRRMAWLSHLPQLDSTAAATALLHSGLRASDMGPGGRDVTRLAESALAVWQPIIERAPKETVAALTALERSLADVRALIEKKDWAALHTLWDQARKWRAERGDDARAAKVEPDR